MTKYEELLNEAADAGVSVDEDFPFKSALKGLYVDNNIALSDRLDTSTEKACILAEELGHHYTTVGDILDPSELDNAKQEQKARLWSYDRLIGLSGLIRAYRHGCRSFYEVAEFLDVTEDCLRCAIDSYHAKCGSYVEFEGYYIYFDPYLTIGKSETRSRIPARDLD